MNDIPPYVYTPGWIIEADSIFKSTLKGYTNALELYDFSFELQNIHSTNGVYGATIAGDMVFKIERGLYIPVLEARYAKNSVINKITISHMQFVNGDYKSTDITIFEKCYIQNMRHDMSFVICSCSFQKYAHITINERGNRAKIEMSFENGMRL